MRRQRSAAVIQRLLETLGVVRVYSREGLEPQFIQVNRLMERWAVSARGGLPLTDAEIEAIAEAGGDLNPPPKGTELDPDTFDAVDRICRSLPEPQHTLVELWWRRNIDDRMNAEMVERVIGFLPGTFWLHANRCLASLRAQFQAEGIDC